MTAIAVSAVLGWIFYRESNLRAEEKVATDNVALLKNLGAPLFLVLLAGLLAFYSADWNFFDLSARMLKVDLFAFGGGTPRYPSCPTR